MTVFCVRSRVQGVGVFAYASEKELQGELDVARLVNLGGDGSGGRRADDCVGQAELHSVGDIKRLRAELEGCLLTEQNALEQRYVEVVDTRPANRGDDARGIPVGEWRRLRESSRIKVTVQAVLNAAGHIGTDSRPTRPLRPAKVEQVVGGGGERQGHAASEGGDPIDLPPAGYCLRYTS